MTPEPEFQQAYTEFVSSLEASSVFDKNPEYRTALEVLAVPEAIAQFRVTWENDAGHVQVNRGYRIHYNTSLGVCKGGIRFHPSVNLSVLKSLGFAQVFKNALTGLSLGGAKGGADFDPKGKSDNEIRRFCQAFMTELIRHIGTHIDIPGGDIGVSEREIGWLFGQYTRMLKTTEGVVTGKGVTWGGTYGRKEAAGYGVVYYVEHMIRYRSEGEESFMSKRVAISGSGNVALHAAIKVVQLGGTVVSLSDSKGSIIADSVNGITLDTIEAIETLKAKRGQLASLNQDGNAQTVKYIPGARPWKHVGQVDVVLPCATQNELELDEAKALLNAGCKYVAEGSNMGCTADAVSLFEAQRSNTAGKRVWFGPGKAANAGGVAVSGLEVTQNSSHEQWSADKVDDKLRVIMRNVFEHGIATAKKYTGWQDGQLPSLVVGTNVAGFVMVADAMRDQGQWW
ncbi:glutamate dehydrogenase (NADP+) [Fusarium oxysporum f. sp. conglutinans race 2 54008]|uniref:Glutamate dehydrogenase n=1 Tax=Fusarium oxysporum f. sp. conglutinans race 2 54008 TaxID=1089457 RepID=X0H424_FUSOX|nr:glutamate dehydrogenase (NADP+) [Fusarium oxysporum f. sp. conglutinans race 2 54008]KAG7000271.1 NADP-specific glutamate dehydrogenase [Fusarium oxysporum f. sp. conglutinans]